MDRRRDFLFKGRRGQRVPKDVTHLKVTWRVSEIASDTVMDCKKLKSIFLMVSTGSGHLHFEVAHHWNRLPCHSLSSTFVSLHFMVV